MPKKPAEQQSDKTRLLRVILTPRQSALLRKLKEQGGTESEHVRRALDAYFRDLVDRGELIP